MKLPGILLCVVITLAVALSGCDYLYSATSPQPPVSYTQSPDPPQIETSLSPDNIETSTVSPTTTTTYIPSSSSTPSELTRTQHPAPTIEISDITPTSPSADYIKREYQWRYRLQEWTWNIQIPENIYDYYKALPRSPTCDYSVYITHPRDDYLIESLAEEIRENAQREGYDEYEMISFAIAFVQSLTYTSDSAGTGYDEYPRYPVETLVDDGGDCEDTSILAASLIDALGYGVVLLVFSQTAETEGHCAVGVAGGEGIYGTYWKYNGRRYYYLETTGKGWEIGEIPEAYQDSTAHIYPMVPVPILTHSWTSEPDGNLLQLKVTVDNLGSAEAEGVYVLAGFDAGNNQIWNRQTSPVFRLGLNECVNATLYLKPPYGEYTRVLVQIVYDGYAVDESYSEWFDL